MPLTSQTKASCKQQKQPLKLPQNVLCQDLKPVCIRQVFALSWQGQDMHRGSHAAKRPTCTCRARWAGLCSASTGAGAIRTHPVQVRGCFPGRHSECTRTAAAFSSCYLPALAGPCDPPGSSRLCRHMLLSHHSCGRVLEKQAEECSPRTSQTPQAFDCLLAAASQRQACQHLEQAGNVGLTGRRLGTAQNLHQRLLWSLWCHNKLADLHLCKTSGLPTGGSPAPAARHQQYSYGISRQLGQSCICKASILSNALQGTSATCKSPLDGRCLVRG